jgi:hypothetical protein
VTRKRDLCLRIQPANSTPTPENSQTAPARIARARRGASQFFLTKIYRAHYMAEVSKLWILRRAVSN